MIDNYNSIVTNKDTVYCLGDFAFGQGSKNPDKYFYRLNGKKHLIVGNHDGKKTIELPWQSVNSMLEIKHNKQRIVLCHFAMRTWNHAYKGVWQLYGHSHATLPETDSLSFDAGVDAWNYKPISFDEVKKKMDWKIKNKGYFKRHFPTSDDEVRSSSDMNICAKKIKEINERIINE